MPLQTEVWIQSIQPNLFRDNSFAARSLNDSAFVEDKIVHLPQAGSRPGVEVDRPTVPAVIGQRTDDEAMYALREHTTDPILIRDIDAVEVSYDKRQSVLIEQTQALNESIANWMLYDWAAQNPALFTTGASRPAAAPSATGARKGLTRADVRRLRLLFDANDIPQDKRFLLLTAAMYNDLLGDDAILSREYVNGGNLQNGTVDSLYGFGIYVRSQGLVFDNAGTPVKKMPTAVAAATDNAAAIAWHEMSVRRALGEIKVFADDDKPEYYGSLLSALVRAGGRAARLDYKGVAAIMEAAG